SQALPIDADVELALARSLREDPDDWETVATLPKGEQTMVVEQTVEGGARVRLVYLNDVGEHVRTREQFVSSQDRVRRKPAQPTHKKTSIQRAETSDLCVEDWSLLTGLADEFLKKSNETAEILAQRITVERKVERRPDGTRIEVEEPWLWLQQAAHQSYGPR